MLGAILGDIVGSPFEFDWRKCKRKDFALLSENSHFTDDTVMTVAVASPRQNSGCHSSRMPMSAQTISPHRGAEVSAICSGL